MKKEGAACSTSNSSSNSLKPSDDDLWRSRGRAYAHSLLVRGSTGADILSLVRQSSITDVHEAIAAFVDPDRACSRAAIRAAFLGGIAEIAIAAGAMCLGAPDESDIALAPRSGGGGERLLS